MLLKADVTADVAERINAILSSSYSPKKSCSKLEKKLIVICNFFKVLQRQLLDKKESLTPQELWQWYIDEVVLLFSKILEQLNDKGNDIAYYFKLYKVSIENIDLLLSNLNKFLSQVTENIKSFFAEFSMQQYNEPPFQAVWQKTYHLLGKKDFRSCYAGLVSINTVAKIIQRYQYVVAVALKRSFKVGIFPQTQRQQVTAGNRVELFRKVSPEIFTRAQYEQLQAQFARKERELTEQIAMATTREQRAIEVLEQERATYVVKEKKHRASVLQYEKMITELSEKVAFGIFIRERHEQLQTQFARKERELTEQIAIATASEQRAIEVLERERAAYVVKEKQYRARVLQYEQRVAEYKKEMRFLQLRLAKEKSEQSTIGVQQKSELTERLVRLEQQAEILKKEFAVLSQRQSEQQTAKQRISVLEARIVEMNEETENYKRQLAAATTEIEDYKLRLIKAQQQHEEECTGLREAIQDLEQEVERAEKEVERYRKEKLDYLHQQVEERQFFCEQLQDFRREHEEQVRALQSRNEELDMGLRFYKLRSDGSSALEMEEQREDEARKALERLSGPAEGTPTRSSPHVDQAQSRIGSMVKVTI